MTNTDMGGVVLAAGASTRMGTPKALLVTPAGNFLAVHQANLLASAGCARVVIVVGDPSIAESLADPRVLVHPRWEDGRLSSLQAGLQTLGPCRDGVIVLPVDTVGVSLPALTGLFAAVQADAVRPIRNQHPGRVVRLSARTTEQLLALAPSPEFRLDSWLAERTEWVATDHELGSNVNTPAQWKAARKSLHEELV